jgi:exodeoxyribonuclease VII small subunit
MSDHVESTTSAVEKLPFETAFRKLEETVQRLEEGDLTLKEAISLYEKGTRLAQRCGAALDDAELQVQQLTVARDPQRLGMFFEDEAG